MKHALNHSWEEWADKAESDGRAARKLAKTECEIACFHAQQCAEKYFKAILAQIGKPVPKIHDLLALLTQLKTNDIDLSALKQEIRTLNEYAIDARYPGFSASPAETRLVIQKMEKVLKVCKEILYEE